MASMFSQQPWPRFRHGFYAIFLFGAILLVYDSYVPSRDVDIYYETFLYPNVSISTNPSIGLNDDLTVVTAYFDIGRFQKGSGSTHFTPSLYRRWMSVFQVIESPIIIFVDTRESFERFAEMRIQLPTNFTRIHIVDRKQLWAFRLEPDIAKIFAKPDYPRHPPNTVVAAYSSAMHAKYELMQTAIRDNPFRTRYFCWLDVGLFRNFTRYFSWFGPTVPRFSMHLPPDFRSDSVAYTEVIRRNKTFSIMDIISGNEVWLCGCFFVGRGDILLQWTEEYKAATEKLISAGLMSTDQQVIYAMFNTMEPRTKIQTYRSDGRFNDWFYLGYVAREAGLQRRNMTGRVSTL